MVNTTAACGEDKHEDEKMESLQHDGNRIMNRVHSLLLCTATILLGTMLHATSAWAVHFVSNEELDVDCGHGLHLKQATGVHGSDVHTYAFGGACNLRIVTTDGPSTVATPPLVASAHWDKTSSTYTESLHLLAPITVNNLDPDGTQAHVGTYPEVASFKCDVDPVINRNAHCTLVSQYNDTGWHSPINSKYYTNIGDQADGFAWKPNHNRPLLLGLASKSQAIALSRRNKHQPISCTGLKLVSVHILHNSTRRYHFDGTCELYHTADGSGGLRLTHVFVTGFWNANGQEAQETFDVAVPGNEGGGLYRMANYTCAANPFIHGNVQCSLEKPLNKVAPVYDPITDLRAKHPIAAGRANPVQVAKLLKAHSHSKKPGVKLSEMGSHKGSVTGSRKLHVASAKPLVRKHEFGAKVTRRTTAKSSLPAVQQRSQVHFGGKLNKPPVLKQQAMSTHTMSGHLNTAATPIRANRTAPKTRLATRDEMHLKRMPTPSIHRLGQLPDIAGYGGVTVNGKYVPWGGTLVLTQAEANTYSNGYCHYYNVYYKITNNGNIAAGPFKDVVHMGYAPALAKGGHYIVADVQNGLQLQPHQTRQVRSHELMILHGKNIIKFSLDDGNAIRESNEGNNQLQIVLDVQSACTQSSHLSRPVPRQILHR